MTYQNNLLNASSAGNLAIRILDEDAVTYECVVHPIFIVVDRQNHGIVFALIFRQLILI